MFSIDGLTWDIPCQIERTAEITPSEISGLMLDKSYFNDVLGTYMSYTISIAVPINMRNQYAQIYEQITKPVDGHVFVLPYNNSTITVTARVASISDVYVRLGGGEPYWKGITFTLIANYPSKTMTQSQVVTAGRAPMPDVAEPSIGDVYTYTANGWSVESYPDADDISY